MTLKKNFFRKAVQINPNNVVSSWNPFLKHGTFPSSKKFLRTALLISQKLLKNDPENVAYQSDVAMTLNNLGILLSNMGRIEEAKRKGTKKPSK